MVTSMMHHHLLPIKCILKNAIFIMKTESFNNYCLFSLSIHWVKFLTQRNFMEPFMYYSCKNGILKGTFNLGDNKKHDFLFYKWLLIFHE